MNDFEHGQVLYTHSGTKVRFVADSPDGHIVRQIIHCECSNSYGDTEEFDDDGELRIEPELFKEPPVAAKHAQVKDLAEQITAMQEIVSAKGREARQAQQDLEDTERCHVELIERLKSRHEALSNVDKFIAGEITLFVEHDFYRGPKVLTALDLKSEDNIYHKGVKLITLFGKSSGDLQWRVNQYTDGSGSDKQLHPCASQEEVTATVARLFAEYFEAGREDGKFYYVDDWIKRGKALGVDIPADILAIAEKPAKPRRSTGYRPQGSAASASRS